jgi:hypothetical protein
LNDGATLTENQEEAAESQTVSSESNSDSSQGKSSDGQAEDQPPPPPGTIAIPELENLKGMEDENPKKDPTINSQGVLTDTNP